MKYYKKGSIILEDGTDDWYFWAGEPGYYTDNEIQIAIKKKKRSNRIKMVGFFCFVAAVGTGAILLAQ